MDPPSSYDPSLPPAPPTQIQDLFSPSAVGRYGQWEIGEDWDSLTEDTGTGEKGNVERRWGTLAQRREKEVRDPPHSAISDYDLTANSCESSSLKCLREGIRTISSGRKCSLSSNATYWEVSLISV